MPHTVRVSRRSNRYFQTGSLSTKPAPDEAISPCSIVGRFSCVYSEKMFVVSFGRSGGGGGGSTLSDHRFVW